MLGPSASRRTRIAVDILALVSAVAIILAGWALFDRFQQTNERRRDLAAIDHRNCVAIEDLKLAQRQEAILNFKQLDRNGKLLHIKITPEIRRVAKQARDRRLHRFASKPCPPGPDREE